MSAMIRTSSRPLLASETGIVVEARFDASGEENPLEAGDQTRG